MPWRQVFTIQVFTIQVLTIQVFTIQVFTIQVFTIQVLTIQVFTIQVFALRVFMIPGRVHGLDKHDTLSARLGFGTRFVLNLSEALHCRGSPARRAASTIS